MEGEGIFRDFDPHVRKSINTGYIVLPDNEERKAAVDKCLRTERVSILVENGGGILHGCYITKSALRDIKFPQKGETLGSGVVFFSEPYNGKAIVTGVVSKNDESSISSEEVVTFRKMKDGNYALLTLDGNGAINLDILGKGNRGAINVNIRNDNSNAKLNIHVKGSINVYTEGSINIKVVDGDVNVSSKGNINISPDVRFNVGKATESMVLGDTLKENLKKTNEVVKAIQDAFTNWTVTPNDGGAALKTAVTSNLVGKTIGVFDKINSKKSFLE